jgi:hypothetical protein
MAALPRTRRIEEILKQAQLDPRLIAIICEIAERQRVQHQQIYECAKLIVGIQESYIEMTKKIGIRDGNLEKLGVKEMMQNFQKQKGGALVSSVEEFDTETSAHNDSRTKN